MSDPTDDLAALERGLALQLRQRDVARAQAAVIADVLEAVNVSVRPRGGQRWRDRVRGSEVRVQFRRSGNPMAGVRPHSDMRWSLVAYVSEDGSRGGILHESDFVKQFEFVGAR